MSRGKRYDGEQKLNLKKVFAVIIAFAVIIMFIIGITRLFNGESDTQEKTVALEYFPVYTNGKWGVIDSRGNTIIEPTYDEYIVIPDSTQAIFICTYDVNYEDGTYSTRVLNERNEELYTDYDHVEALENYDESNNLWYEDGILRVEQDGMAGIINTNGQLIVECQYDSIEALKGVDNSLLTEQDGSYGIVDSIGNVIIENNYQSIEPLSNQYEDGYVVENSDGQFGLIGYSKEVILETNYDDIKNVHSDGQYYIVREGENWEVIDREGTTYLAGDYDDILSVNNGNVIVEDNNQYGIVSTDGTTLVEPQYDSISYTTGNNYKVEQDGKFGVINTS